MSSESTNLRMLAYGLKGHIANTEALEKIIITHALAAATAAVASGWIPEAGGAIATGVAFGFILSMYYKICKECNIKISKNMLKTLASIVVAETAAYLAVTIAAEVALSFLPLFGNFTAAFVASIANFGMVYVAGVLFLKMMVNVFKANIDINNISESDHEDIMRNISTEDAIKKAYKESKNVYKDTKNDKTYNTDDIKPSDD